MRFRPAAVALTALVAACVVEDASGTAAPDVEPPLLVFTPEMREFRDWRAVCDNLGQCAAYGADGMIGGWVMVSRDAGAAAPPRISAGLPFDLESTPRLRLDGQTFDAAGDDALASVRSLAQGRTLALDEGGQTVELSLSGAAAALLWIDEKQGRIDTPTAIMRPGDGDPDAVPGPGQPSPVAAAAPLSQAGLPQDDLTLPPALARLPEVLDCTAGQMPDMTPIHSVARLSPGVYLWGVECFRGAYNLGQSFWITGEDGADPRRAEFPSALGESDNELVNAVYDPETATLDAFARGRGLGDCGLIQHWTWTGERFALTLETAMQSCAGMTPGHWPTLYRADP